MVTPFLIQDAARSYGIHVSVNHKLDDFHVKSANGASLVIPANIDLPKGAQVVKDWLEEIAPKRKKKSTQILYRADAVYLNDELPEIDIDGCEMECPTGKCAVMMAPERTETKGFLLGDTLKGALRPDIGRVVAVDPECPGLERGDYVVCRPYAGFVFEKYHKDQRIQFFGRVMSELQEFENTPFDDYILMKRTDGRFAPFGRNMRVERARQGSYLLPVELAKFEDFGTVREVGDGIAPDFVGRRVWWEDRGPEELLHIEFADEKDMFILHGELLYMVEMDEAA